IMINYESYLSSSKADYRLAYYELQAVADELGRIKRLARTEYKRARTDLFMVLLDYRECVHHLAGFMIIAQNSPQEIHIKVADKRLIQAYSKLFEEGYTEEVEELLKGVIYGVKRIQSMVADRAITVQ